MVCPSASRCAMIVSFARESFLLYEDGLNLRLTAPLIGCIAIPILLLCFVKAFKSVLKEYNSIQSGV